MTGTEHTRSHSRQCAAHRVTKRPTAQQADMSKTKSEFIGDIDFSNVSFGQLDTRKLPKVDIFRDAGQTRKFTRLALCRESELNPMRLRFNGLDDVKEDGHEDRRGLAIVVEDPDVIRSLHSLDEAVLKQAMACSKEWFKKEIKEESVMRDRYLPILSKYRDDDHYMMKIKIKAHAPGSRMIPTDLHLRKDDGEYILGGASLSDINKGALVSPIVSLSYGIYIAGTGSFGVTVWADEIIVRPGSKDRQDLSHFCSSVPLPIAAEETGGGGMKRRLEEDSKEDAEMDDKKQRTAEVELMGAAEDE